MTASESKTARRAMRLKVPADLLVSMLKDRGSSFRVMDGALPADAKALDVGFDPVTNAISILVASGEFQPVPEGTMPPTHPGVRLGRVRTTTP